jgi:glutathione S-transferase
MKLHVTPPSPRAFKVVAVMHHLGLEPELAILDLVKGDQMKPEFIALNPNHRMPVLEDDGFVLWESNAIMQYLASKRPESGLWPADPVRQADVSRWQCWELAHWEPACGTLLFERFVKQLLGQGDPDRNEVARGERQFHEFAQVLDRHLGDRDWLVGRAVTLADFSVGCWLTCAQLGQYPVSGYREIGRWHRGLESLPAWQRSIVMPPRP